MDQQNQNVFDLQIDQQTFSYFSESAKWAKFLAIVGFVYCALLIILALFAGAVLATMMPMMGAGAGGEGAAAIGGGFITVFYLLIALVYFFPCLYLYKFASQMQLAIGHNDATKMQSSVKNLKSFFKFFGIITIIILAVMVLAMVGMVIGLGALAT